ncbi:hypothetical protein HID58_041486 [Brassica napus]|uniref:(rape) hypothetical protein n=1 Tax=Brassica napus TaxID=3708 RepID=A0A816RIH9_BRANA|nr:hypothetical protein HID58_041486 [Brassica napus]CAF2070848.1 unnamed protein product [Brassica napus]
MTSPDDVGLLSLIESSHAGDIFASVSDYLRPFSTLQSTSRKGPNTHPPLPRQAVPPFPQQIDLASTQTPLRRRLLIPTRNLAIQREISSKRTSYDWIA